MELIKKETLNLLPEEYLLFLSARTELDDETADKMKNLLRKPLNWHQIMLLSERLGIQPLLCKHLSEKRYASSVPDDIMQELQKKFRYQEMRSIRLYALINEIADTMNQGNIPIIYLKGAFLAKEIYKEIALRPMNDIDILCRKEEVQAVREKMNALGYDEQKITGQSRLHDDFIAHQMSDRLPPFIDNKGNKVDIHFSIYHSPLTDEKVAGRRTKIMQNVWDKALPFSLDGVSAYSLSPEDLLLHLSVHLHKHLSPYFGVAPLYWFCDIHEVIKYYEKRIDWQEFCAKSDVIGKKSEIGIVLNLIKKNWRIPIPDDVIRDLGGNEQEQISLCAIFRKKEDYQYHYTQIFKTAWEIPEWKNRLYFLLGFIFPTQAYLISRYQPKNLSYVWLLYFLHPFRLFLKVIRKLLRSEK